MPPTGRSTPSAPTASLSYSAPQCPLTRTVVGSSVRSRSTTIRTTNPASRGADGPSEEKRQLYECRRDHPNNSTSYVCYVSICAALLLAKRDKVLIYRKLSWRPGMIPQQHDRGRLDLQADSGQISFKPLETAMSHQRFGANGDIRCRQDPACPPQSPPSDGIWQGSMVGPYRLFCHSIVAKGLAHVNDCASDPTDPIFLA